MKLFALCLSLAVICGCASNQQIQTVRNSEPRPAVSLDKVKLMDSPPANSVCLATIYAYGDNTYQGANLAQMKLKKEAAAVGANVLCIEDFTGINRSVESDSCCFSARAYFLPPQ